MWPPMRRTVHVGTLQSLTGPTLTWTNLRKPVRIAESEDLGRTRENPVTVGRHRLVSCCLSDDAGRSRTVPVSQHGVRLKGDGRLPDEELTEQLNRLRAQAGNPSVRELAKLTEQQGPGRAMSRSTVQDKLSGKNPPRLGQILALVQACADYANLIGAPLPAKETDEQVWRERTRTAPVRTSPPVAGDKTANPSPALRDMTSTPPPVTGNVTASPSPKWDLDPLIRAGMYDMVDLIQDNEGRPMADWLPTLVEALREARMSNEQFLRAASRQQPQDVVASILALAHEEELEALNRLIFLCAMIRPAGSIPMILALLRRKGRDTGDELAHQLVETITKERFSSITIRSDDCVDIVRAVRSATMERDATLLLEGIGEYGHPNLVLEVVASFPDSRPGDQGKVLRSVAKGSPYRLSVLFKALRKTTLDGIDPAETLDSIIFGIPYGKHSEIASDLQERGLHEEAARILELQDEPPF